MRDRNKQQKNKNLYPKLANPETEISKPINISAPNADLFVMNTA